MDTLNIDKKVLRDIFSLQKDLLVYATALQSKTFLCLDSFLHSLILGKINLYLTTSKPIFSLLLIKMKNIGNIALTILKPD